MIAAPTLTEVAVLGAVQGVAELLPISASGHDAAIGIWLDAGARARALEALFQLGVVAAIVLATRRRLAFVIGEGVRAIARPALFRTSPGGYDAAFLVLAGLASGAVRAALGPSVRSLATTPIAVGIGLLATAALLAATAFAPRGRASAPSPGGAVIVGLVHGLAVLPGASGTAVALASLLFLGVRPARALELSLLLTIPVLGISALHALFTSTGTLAGVDGLTASAGVIVALSSAAMALVALRALVSRQRLAWLGLWLVPLGLATIAYGRALALAPASPPVIVLASSDAPLAACAAPLSPIAPCPTSTP